MYKIIEQIQIFVKNYTGREKLSVIHSPTLQEAKFSSWEWKWKKG